MVDYRLQNGVLTVKNDLFSKDFSAIASAEMQQKSPKSRSLPFSRVTATREDGSKVSFDLWEDLPTVRISDDSEPILFHLTGEHWMVRAVKLNAFTDDER